MNGCWSGGCLLSKLIVVWPGRSSYLAMLLYYGWPSWCYEHHPLIVGLLVDEETSTIRLLEYFWRGGRARLFLGRLVQAASLVRPAWFLRLSLLAPRVLRARRSFIALNQRAGGGRCTLAPLSLSIASLLLRLAKDSRGASSCCRALATNPPSALVMMGVDDWHHQAVQRESL